MLSLITSSDDLFQAIASLTESYESKLEVITRLKAHVKKNFINLDQVPRYFEALAIAVDIPDPGIHTSSFSVLCHLVKRISMQDKGGSVLKNQSFLVLPIIINGLGDTKTGTISSAKKALEAYWFSAPKKVEEFLVEMALKNRNKKVTIESLNWLAHIVTNISPQFKINNLLPSLVSLLSSLNNDRQRDAFEKTRDFLTLYYSRKSHRQYKFDLVRELEIQNVNAAIQEDIINAINTETSIMNGAKGFVSAGSTRVTVNLSQRENDIEESRFSLKRSLPHHNSRNTSQNRNTWHTSSIAEPLNPQDSEIADKYNDTKLVKPDLKSSSPQFNTELLTEIQKIVKDLGYNIDDSILSMEIVDVEPLHHLVNEMASIFGSKETEFNWSKREHFIVKMRSLVRGNARTNYLPELITCIKDVSEAICKGMSSLRTTLCSHSCNLVKECAIILKGNFDSLVESFFPTLMKLCSATKHITSTNAHMALCAIYINCSYNSKLLQRISLASNEKTVQPRTYGGVWLQIFIIRFHNENSFVNNSITNGIEVSTKTVIRLLSDPNPKVRQVGRESYWIFWKYFPNDAGAVLSKVDTNVVRAIQRSRADEQKVHSAPLISNNKERPSLKKSIIAKNKELRSRQKEMTVLSRPSSGPNSELQPNHRQGSKDAIDPSHNKRQYLNPESETKVFEEGKQAISVSTSAPSKDLAIKVSSPLSVDSLRKDNMVIDLTRDISSIKNSQLAFDKHKDPILKFLSSNQTDLVIEGVNLLKYAVMGDEDLSSDINEMLRKISIRQPHLLEPLFLTTDNLFKRTSQFLKPDDYIRTCCILKSPIENKTVDLLISAVNVDDLYESMNRLLSYAVSVSNILDDDGELTMLIIKYKSIIILLIIQLLLKGLDKIPITDRHFLKLTSNLLDLIGLLRYTDIFPMFSSLLGKLYSINPTLFGSELGLRDDVTKEDVEVIVGVDHTLVLDNNMNIFDDNYESLFDLTKVDPSKAEENFSPVKMSTDFTMLVPVAKDDHDFTFIPKKLDIRLVLNKESDFSEPLKLQNFNLNAETSSSHNNSAYSQECDSMDVDYKAVKLDDYVEREQSALMDGTSQINNEGHQNGGDSCSGPTLSHRPNVFVDYSVNTKKSDLFSKLHKGDEQSELADDFAQFEIAKLPKQGEDIQKFIERLDPLSNVSSKNRPINIYEDMNHHASPQKVKEYNYSDLNWFNFRLSSYTRVSSMGCDLQSCQGQFENICLLLAEKNINSNELVTLLGILQELREYSSEFLSYFKTAGKLKLERSLWDYFNGKLSRSEIFNGLIIIKQLLINRVELNLDQLLLILISLSDRADDFFDQLYYALSECYDEMLSGIYTSANLFIALFSHFGRSEYSSQGVHSLFLLECISKLLNVCSVSFLLNDAFVKQLDNLIRCFIDNEVVEIRRAVVLCYSIILKSARNKIAVSNEIDVSSELLIDKIIQDLSLPQRKLIEYYSRG
ncbi:uncharacterized protein PRCAT00001584001 [Priceomyces carsonii]|uniref:uncharacterized protein n=1 Tax=Priceomyces carsonii TaxID=28549 RepID=UPI002ED9233E|nr:unnamed protein product [Priceomyces carsonii]